MNSQTRATSPDDVGAPILAVVRRRWKLLVLTTLAALAVALAGLSFVAPSYRATATLQAPIPTGVQSSTDPTTVDRVMNTYAQLAQQPRVTTQVSRRLATTDGAAFGVNVIPNTELLQLSATAHTARAAQRAANLAAVVLVTEAGGLSRANAAAGDHALVAQLRALSTTLGAERLKLAQTPGRGAGAATRLTLQQQITGDQANYQALVQQRAQLQLADAVHNQPLSVLQPASLPTSPFSPKRSTVLALAAVLGLLGGLAFILFLERLAPRLYTVDAIETAAGAEVIATIPRVPGKAAHAGLYNGNSRAQEVFGVLAAHVVAEAERSRQNKILVTSRSRGDGKSTVAGNLAAELARCGNKVLLIDADMRRPSVHHIFAVSGLAGLSDILADSEAAATLDGVIVDAPEIPNLALIPAGPAPAGPARLLASARLGELIRPLGERYDYIVFDAPPLDVSDPLSIVRLSDLVLLVIAGHAVADREIQAATRQLASIGARDISVVVNRWRGQEAEYAYPYNGRS